jgi:signal transduction histidine kinase
MAATRYRTQWYPERVAVALLGATFLVTALLLGQAVLALRSQERLVEATLRDFAAFAAHGVAAELDQMFGALFLDQIAVSRAAHYAWITAPDREPRVPSGRRSVPDGAIPVHFSIDAGRVVAHDGELDADTERWILQTVGPHARDVFPAPAPYAVLRTGAPGGGSRTVVYRREEAYEGVSIYGFLVRFEAFGPNYARAVEAAPLLPRSLAHQHRPEELVAVDLVFPQDEGVLYTRPGPASIDVVRGEAFAAKAGRMAVRVELDLQQGRELVASGPSAPVPLFAVLTVLTLGLFLGSLALLRRAGHLQRMRERFVENVSHDLRTPLAQIRMFSETLLLGRIREPQERRRSLEIIHQQATNLGDLVDNILHATTHDSAPVAPEATDVGELARRSLEALDPSARVAGMRLALEYTGPDEVSVDPGALRRILNNLVDNAIKYGRPGQTITVSLTSRGDDLEIAVTDQGPGVPSRDRVRVWQRFLRLERDESAVTGTGLGLAVVRDLAERHGGTVRFEEPPDGGARVVVVLATGAVVVAARPPVRSSPTGNGERSAP